VGGIRADRWAGGADDVGGAVQGHDGDAVAGQQPGQGAVTTADIGDTAAALGEEAAGDSGMDVTSRRESLGGGLARGEAAGISVVVAGKRLARARLRSRSGVHA
jgi:hypothetical protein